MEQQNQFYAALSKAQSEIRSIKKTGTNPHFRSAYAELDEVCDYVLPILAKNGLSIIQSGIIENERLFLETYLLHTSGGSHKSLWPVSSLNAKPQEIGSATSYARRYALMAMVGLSANDDDDGNEAQKTHNAQNTKPNEKERAAIESKDPAPMPPSGNVRAYSGPSEAQLKRLYAIANSSGWPRGMAEAWVKRSYEKKPSELTRSEYDATCDALKATKFNDILKEELKPFMPIDIKAQFEAEKKKQSSYVDHTKTPLTPPAFDDDEIPF